LKTSEIIFEIFRDGRHSSKNKVESLDIIFISKNTRLKISYDRAWLTATATATATASLIVIE
jgi:hypothetical protein